MLHDIKDLDLEEGVIQNMSSQKAHLLLLMPAFNEILKVNDPSINIIISEIYSLIYQ